LLKIQYMLQKLCSHKVYLQFLLIVSGKNAYTYELQRQFDNQLLEKDKQITDMNAEIQEMKTKILELSTENNKK